MIYTVCVCLVCYAIIIGWHGGILVGRVNFARHKNRMKTKLQALGCYMQGFFFQSLSFTIPKTLF
jgi:hypothetical protein